MMVSVLFLLCDQPTKNEDVVSKNSSRSGCLGRTALQNNARITVDTAQYCWAERLYWSYDGQKILLLHTRRFHLCDAQMYMRVIKVNNQYVIAENDTADRSGGGSMPCDCPFDTYCELPIDTNSIEFKFGSDMYQIDLTTGSGCFLIDTTEGPRFMCNLL
jgi:hypothetical protein